MILDGVCYSAFIQYCRVILSRMAEPYCIQSFLVLTSTVFVEYPASLLISYLHHLPKTLALSSGEGVSTGDRLTVRPEAEDVRVISRRIEGFLYY